MVPAELQAEAVLAHLGRVLASPKFARNERMSRFLRFVVESDLSGRTAALKESVIGVEVFGRKPGYDPQQDAIVRTEAARLRARLAEYYQGEGRTDTIVIDLPKGGYFPRFRQVEAAGGTIGSKSAPPSRRLVPALAGLALVLAGLGGWRWYASRGPIPIAVLPFANLSQNPADGYFADGITNEMIRNLSILDGIAVRSETSSFVFKGKPRNIRDAGRQLGVDYILEGSVEHSGEQCGSMCSLFACETIFRCGPAGTTLKPPIYLRLRTKSPAAL